MFSIILLPVLVLVILCKVYLKLKPYYEFSKKYKHYKGVPLNMIKVNPEDCYEKVLAPIFRGGYDSFFFGPFFTIPMNNPDDIKIAMNSEKCHNKCSTYECFFKYGLLTEGGEKYKQQRKSLNPLFSPSNLKTLTPIINRNVKEFMEKNKFLMETGQFEMRELVSKFTIHTVFNTLIGIGSIDESDDQKFAEASHIADQFMTITGANLFKPWTHFNLIKKLTKDYYIRRNLLNKLLGYVEKFFNSNQGANNEGITFFSVMKKHFDGMDHEEYSESVAVFLGAAYETTAGTISVALFFLALHQDKQEILFKEISSILSSYEDEVNEEKINNMPYLDLVIKETMRLLPNNIFIGRVTSEDVKFTNFTAPKNAMLLIPTLDTHRNKKLWGDDALVFKPERFEPENFKNIHPYAYIPFSNGGRMCPGYKYALLTLKIFLSRFIMNYRVTTNMKYEDLEYIFGLTLDFKKRPLLSVTKR